MKIREQSIDVELRNSYMEVRTTEPSDLYDEPPLFRGYFAARCRIRPHTYTQSVHNELYHVERIDIITKGYKLVHYCVLAIRKGTRFHRSIMVRLGSQTLKSELIDPNFP